MTQQTLQSLHPEWDAELREQIESRASLVQAPDGACLFSPGDNSEHFLIALSGSVRVEQTSATGRTIVLYRVEPGDTCVMTTSCLFSGAPYSAYGYAEGAVTALSLGANAFHSLLAQSAEFRTVVFEVFSQRVAELSEVIDELLLHRVDQKLALWLANRGKRDPQIRATHQAIAAELGTAREVVSRILKDFDRRGWVDLHRGLVDIRDIAALTVYSNSAIQ